MWTLESSDEPCIDSLFRRPAYSHGDDWEAAFTAAMREACAGHFVRSAELAALARDAGVTPESLRTLADVEALPWISVAAFKERDLSPLRPSEVVLRLTSSGTGGQHTQLRLDAVSLNRMLVNDFLVHQGMGVLEQDGPCNCQIFGYAIEDRPTLGPAHSSWIISEMAPFAERRALIRDGGAGLAFDLERALADYVELCESGRPLRWIGYPAFMFLAARAIRERGLPRVPAPASSWIQPAGGWKSHAAAPVERGAFGELVSDATGIPPDHVRDLFGMTEHGVGYMECERGRMHVPVFAHAVVRDPFTLAPLPDGEPGLLHLYSPMLRSHPAPSLLTTDCAVRDSRPCPCGRGGATLRLVRRYGLDHYQTCAVQALQYLPA